MSTDAIDDLPPEDPFPMDAEETTWPRAIGVLSVIYAIIGMLCQVMSVGLTIGGPMLAKAFSGADITVPPMMKYPTLVIGFITFCLGLYMMTGGVALMRRRREGVGRLKRWAMLRLVLLLLYLAVSVFILPANIEFQRQMQDFSNDQVRSSGRADLVQEFNEDMAWTSAIISTGMATVIVSAYPVLIVFFLSRRKINEEIDNWM